ncbi:MAG: acyl-CoA dehydrogenase family protein [Geminocystis sp.]|nr:acyl-CoA dehydrogenase family protein [Geminocystis sp.]MCS7146572.1 acyl-CoA dehydrogenase family protein [Geminocystis sp.]MDW8115398.1 acyl-CoA dehydrogenase family protein [Geminocystis sp.]MDW8462939.1 acyl-CoA dehydrogenase family protein [Geminocystis sp.]
MGGSSKLVRDKIPEFLPKNNTNYRIVQLTDEDYKRALKAKLLEESQEVLSADSIEDLTEEIADIYEVLDALIKAYNIDRYKLEIVRYKKAEKKGKFEKKLQLTEVIRWEEIGKPEEEKLIKEAEAFLEKEITPNLANVLDHDFVMLRDIFLRMHYLNPLFFRLKLSQEWGGVGMSNLGFYKWQVMMARYSGALSFLQTQHQSALGFINQSENQKLQEKYLSLLKEKNLFFGVAFSHLRREGKPLVTASVCEGGYQLDGFLPWVTGYGIFSYLIVGATLPDGRELYGIIPFESQPPALEFSQPLKLLAMGSTNTVTARLQGWFLPEEEVVFIKPKDSIHVKDKDNVLHHGFFPLGCSQAALQVLRENLNKIHLPSLEKVYMKLEEEEKLLRGRMFSSLTNPDIRFADKLKLRGEAIHLAHRCTLACIISSKGSASLLDNTANRLHREALLYSVSGQTRWVLEESLLCL